MEDVISSNGTRADGKIIFDPEEVRAVAKDCGVESVGPYLKLNSGNKVLKYKNIGEIDTRKKYSDEELFEKYDLPYSLGACKQVIMQSKEVIKVPDDVGVRLLRRLPLSQKHFMTGPDPGAFYPLSCVVNSGWVDSGYKGKITMQPFASLECILGETNPICLGIVYKYDKKVSKSYDGHYHNGKSILNS